MPMGNSARFEAVLRAGEAHRRKTAPTGIDPPKNALRGAAAADALAKPALKGGSSAPTVMARKAQALKADQDDDGDFGGAQAMEGFGGLGNQSAVKKVGKQSQGQATMVGQSTCV